MISIMSPLFPAWTPSCMFCLVAVYSSSTGTRERPALWPTHKHTTASQQSKRPQDAENSINCRYSHCLKLPFSDPPLFYNTSVQKNKKNKHHIAGITMMIYILRANSINPSRHHLNKNQNPNSNSNSNHPNRNRPTPSRSSGSSTSHSIRRRSRGCARSWSFRPCDRRASSTLSWPKASWFSSSPEL